MSTNKILDRIVVDWRFKYDIPLQDLTIITAPNGYGKSMLLDIVHMLNGDAGLYANGTLPRYMSTHCIKAIKFSLSDMCTLSIKSNSPHDIDVNLVDKNGYKIVDFSYNVYKFSLYREYFNAPIGYDSEKKLLLDILEKRGFEGSNFYFEQGYLYDLRCGGEVDSRFYSSGELLELITWSSLLLRVPRNSLILLDDVGTNAHVVWQRDFVKDLLRVMELKNMQVIMTTHSPQVIGHNWDIVIDLYDLSKGDGEL